MATWPLSAQHILEILARDFHMKVTLSDIKKYFGPVKANDGITVTLEEGRIYGLLGENGAGKSTLMKVLSGYHMPTSGSIYLDHQEVVFDSPAKALSAGIGMIYQDPLDVSGMRVIENHILGRDNHVRLERPEAVRELTDTATRMGFSVDPNAFIDELSLGERQQLELLRLLALGAELLILDEPTTGISSDQKEGLFASIRALAREQSKIVILVSHKLSEVQELCDQVIVLRKGRLVGEADMPSPTEALVGMMFEEVPPKQSRTLHKQDEPALAVENVTIEGDRLTISNINLNVHRGEVFGLAGLEGSGQQLLMQACAGLVRSTSGQIKLNGQDITQYGYKEARASGVAYLPAGRLEEGLIGGLTIMEHLALATPQKGLRVDWDHFASDAQTRIDRYQVVGTPESRVEELSGGNQQRTLYALLTSPLKLLLLEQPTRGLDVRSADWIWNLLFERTAEGTAIVFISADLDELVERSDRIAAFSGGVMSRVVDAAETTTDELGHLIGGEA